MKGNFKLLFRLLAQKWPNKSDPSEEIIECLKTDKVRLESAKVPKWNFHRG